MSTHRSDRAAWRMIDQTAAEVAAPVWRVRLVGDGMPDVADQPGSADEADVAEAIAAAVDPTGDRHIRVHLDMHETGCGEVLDDDERIARAYVQYVIAGDWASEVSAELRMLADQVGSLSGKGLPKPSFVRVYIPTGLLRSESDRALRTLAGIGHALGMTFGDRRTSSGRWETRGEVERGPVSVAVEAPIPDPADPRDVEIARLRARLAEVEGGAA